MNVRVASYNVQNLFMDRDLKPGGHTRTKSEASLAALAESIERMDADVVSLQELASQETLEGDLLSRRDLAKKYPHVAWTKGNDERGIRVGIISKYPFTLIKNHSDAEFPLADGSGTGQFSRDLLRVDVNTDADPEAELTVYTSHFKSRRPANPGEVDSDLRRLSEGQATRKIVEAEMKEFPNRMFVVTGDLNDNTNDPPVQAILNGAEAGAEKWVDSLDHLGESARNTWPSNPTKKGRFGPEQFDHIIYPERFDNQVTRHAPVRFEQSIDSDTRWVSSRASDHLPIMADIEIRD
jgi:endonuclease/exonuclease/phosphatase family metal-dependent hydrolase